MCTIISDSSTLYTRPEAEKNGFFTCPLRVQVADGSFIDMEEISSEALLRRIDKEKAVPYTSQPPLGEKMELYEKYGKEQSVVDICMADGLSGTYQSAMMAKSLSEHPENIHVFNSKTLCGPHRAMVEKALEMNREGKDTEKILTMLEKSSASDISFLIPFDFSFLKRGGRVRGMEASLGSMLKLIPVMKKTEDGMHLEKAGVARTLKKAFSLIIQTFKEAGMNSDFLFYITHADNTPAVKKAFEMLAEAFPGASILTYPLSPAFIAQGGPGCIAIQAIRIQE